MFLDGFRENANEKMLILPVANRRQSSITPDVKINAFEERDLGSKSQAGMLTEVLRNGGIQVENDRIIPCWYSQII